MIFTIIINVTLAVTFFCCLFYSTFKWKTSYWSRRGIKSPKCDFVFGNIKDGVLRKLQYHSVFKNLYESHPKEKVLGVYRMWSPALLVRDPEIIKHMLIKDFDQFIDRGVEFSKSGLGQNLFHADGDNWRLLRSRLSPVFTSGKLKNMMHLMIQQAEKFMNEMKNIANEEIEICRIIQKFTIGSIASTAFGFDVNMNDIDSEGSIYRKIDKLIFSSNRVVEFDFMFPGLLKTLNLSLFPGFLINFFDGLVEQIMQERGGKPSGRKDFMDLLLEMRNVGEIVGGKKFDDEKEKSLEITNDIMAAQAFVFYAAGYETSATTISYLMYSLAMNQDIQDKLYNEINEVLQKSNGEITFETLKEMNYMGQVFDETLRMYPVVDVLQRVVCNSSYKIPSTDVVLEKGTLCLFSVPGLQYDEQYYPDPYRFDPERFTPDNVKERHPCVYLPFGNGPRNCVGMRFAKVQSRLAITNIIKNYRVVPTDRTPKSIVSPTVYDPTRALISVKGGIPLKFVPR